MTTPGPGAPGVVIQPPVFCLPFMLLPLLTPLPTHTKNSLNGAHNRHFHTTVEPGTTSNKRLRSTHHKANNHLFYSRACTPVVIKSLSPTSPILSGVCARSILTPVSLVVRKQEEAYLSGRRKARFQLGSFRFSPHLAQQDCIVPHDFSCEWMIRSQYLLPNV